MNFCSKDKKSCLVFAVDPAGLEPATKQVKVKELLLLQNLKRVRHGFAIGALITFLHFAYFLYQLPDTYTTTHGCEQRIIILDYHLENSF